MNSKHGGARWLPWPSRGIWRLFARARDGGDQLATIERRNGKYFWCLGDSLDDTATNEHQSLYGAQRAVRKALREEQQSMQREILEDMQAGESLEQDGWGFFQIVRSGERRRRVSDVSCRGLLERGLIEVSKHEEHSGYAGGKRTWYALTNEGKAAIK